MRLRDRLGIGPDRQRQLTWFMETTLFGMFFVGFWEGNVGIMINTGIGLLVTQLPPILERDYDITLDTGLTLWITAAVWLHAVGVLGIPGAEQNLYASTPFWDKITHALSSSIVAAAGYTTVRALDAHSDEIHVPPRFMFVFILLFVLAFGVFWEVIEFAVGQFAAATGTKGVLTQYGLEDTMFDLVFDTVGAVIVAVWGTAHLTDVVGTVTGWLETREA